MVSEDTATGASNTGISDQAEYWNGRGGNQWVTHADRIEALLLPFIPELLTRAGLKATDAVLDIGCGAGSLTFEAAGVAHAGPVALGVDISGPLLALARQRARDRGARAAFVLADAGAYRADHLFDAALSRFGVMFFEDPVSAFENLRGGMRGQGRLTFLCWQALQNNDWARVPLTTVLPFLPEPPQPPEPGMPGPFAFADVDYLSRILTQAGWQGVEVEGFETELTIPGDTVEAAADFCLEMGPSSRLLTDPDLNLDPIRAALAEDLAEWRRPDGAVRLSSATWFVTARAP